MKMKYPKGKSKYAKENKAALKKIEDYRKEEGKELKKGRNLKL